MVMDKRVRDIYLIYLGLQETPEYLNKSTAVAEGGTLWYKGNIIELPAVMKLIRELK
jgi:hypothetical protein